MIWVWSVLLFLAGVTWGSIKLKTNFYTVDNVHDLFEIFSSAATVVAVIFAAFSFNDWRSQIKAQSDHDLARRLAVSMLKYKQSIQIAYSDAQFCVNHCLVGFEGLPPDLLKSVVDDMIRRMSDNLSGLAELQGILLEVRALWGDKLPNSLDSLFNACQRFHGCVRLFSVASLPTAAFEQQDSFKTKIIQIGEIYKGEGWVEGKILNKAGELLQTADEIISSKLLS
jgi:hypothetical protein